MRHVRSSSAQHTIDIASSFAQELRRGAVVALFGELGSGKTQFVKGVCRSFGVDELVASPTFILLNRYSGKEPSGNELLLYHFDFYRIRSLDEIYDLGYEEFLRPDGICLIEWAEALGELLPHRRYDVHLTLGKSEEERLISIEQVNEKNIGITSPLNA
jgi:tRNA threonylcarbamoyladenosine biosynthesis protein TsaE